MDRSDVLSSLGISCGISLGLAVVGAFLLDGMGLVTGFLLTPLIFGIVLASRISRRR